MNKNNDDFHRYHLEKTPGSYTPVCKVCSGAMEAMLVEVRNKLLSVVGTLSKAENILLRTIERVLVENFPDYDEPVWMERGESVLGGRR